MEAYRAENVIENNAATITASQTENQYQMVCVDLDGTLLNDQHMPNPSAVAALKTLVKKGVHVVVSTGRHPVDARFYASQIDQSAYYIAANGAAVGKVDSKELQFAQTMDAENLRQLAAFSVQYDLHPIYYSETYIYIESLGVYLFHLFNNIRFKQFLSKRLVYVPGHRRMQKRILRDHAGILKIVLFINSPEKADAVERLLREQTTLEVARTFKFTIELTRNGVHKASGIAQLSKQLGVESEQIMAFGDSDNDVQMLAYAGCGVAMGNAAEHVKALADVTTLDNNGEGIRAMLERHFDLSD